jgi:hypothetical protein
MVLLMASMIAACAGGGSKVSNTEVTVRGVKYSIPKNHIRAAALTPANMTFVYIGPPGEKFHLVLDAFKPYLPNKSGFGVPTISRVNDNRFGEYEVVQIKSGVVVCTKVKKPHLDCGLEVDDHGVKWGVLFDKEDIGNSDSIRDRAKAFVLAYREHNG